VIPDSSSESAQAAALRGKLVDEVLERRALLKLSLSSQVESVLRTVPRHLFLPGLPLAETYAQDAPVMKRDERDTIISSVSAPKIIAFMLDQLRVEPGHRVLEIGSGGYNAALLKELVGPDGKVTTLDIDQDIVDRARKALTAAGYDDVNVGCGDGEFGAEDFAPFDRIIVTVQTWDIPRAWMEQLAEVGRLVAPFRIMRGQTRSVAFERDGNHLVSRGYELCGFVPMQGAGENRELLIPLHGEDVGLRVDDGQQVNAELLRQAFAQPKVEAWSGVTVPRMTPFDDLFLWLAFAAPNFCQLVASDAAIDKGLIPRSHRAPTIYNEESFGYLMLRRINPEDPLSEFGVYAHGPSAEKIAEEYVTQIRAWDDRRSVPGPRFEIYPAGTPDDELPEGAHVIDKLHTRVTISWS
jgi:protein-L-isoaspartate(D-aspartate) O-methyltransferase